VETVPLLLVANAVCATVLALAVAAAAGAVRRPAFANRAWLLVLVKLVTPPLVAVPVVWVAGAGEAAAPAPPSAGEPRGSTPRSGEPPPEPAGLNPAARPSDLVPAEPLDLDVSSPLPAPVPDSTAAVALGSASRLNVVESAADPPATPNFPLPRLAFFAWLVGAVGWWALVAARVARFRRLLRSAEPAPADVPAAARAAADRVGLRRLPEVAFVAADVSPMVWATVGRPRVLLPRRLWDALDPDQREAVLAHELAHLARGDHWVRRLELLALGAYWWFPVAWLAVRQLRRAEEECCDAWAAADPGRAAAYAEALVETAAFVSCPGWVPLASGGAARVSQLKRRLTMVLQHPTPPRLRWPAALGLLALAAAALPFAPTLADDPPPTPAAGPTRPVEAREPQDPRPTTPAAEPLPRPDPRPRSTPAEPRTGGPPAAANRYTAAEEVERLKDEVELLAAQRETKMATVRVAETALKQAVTNIARIERLHKSGAAPQEELDKLQSEVENAKAQLDVRRAELAEHEVKMAQAKRRLDRATAPRSSVPNPINPAASRRPADPTHTPPPLDSNSIPPATGDDIRIRFEKLRAEMDNLARETEEFKAARREIEARLKQLDAQEQRLAARRDQLRQLEMDLRKALDKKEPPRP
jgi:beta-lactamase regulating signal transducer with metallopeptidase domain